MKLVLAYAAPVGFRSLKISFVAFPSGSSAHLKTRALSSDRFSIAGLQPPQLSAQKKSRQF